jgi:hypothetical protein
MLTRVRNTILAGVAVFALTACDETSPTPPPEPALTMAQLAGAYTATQAGWTATAHAGTHFDLIGTGGTHEMVILEDGTYTTRIAREGQADLVTAGALTLDQQGALSAMHNGVSRPIDYTFDNGTLTWTDAGAEWDFGAGAGLEGATFTGTFVR